MMLSRYYEFLYDSENDPALDGIDELLALMCRWYIEDAVFSKTDLPYRLLTVADVADMLVIED